jgi:hypothetical protein
MKQESQKGLSALKCNNFVSCISTRSSSLQELGRLIGCSREGKNRDKLSKYLTVKEKTHKSSVA